MSETTKQAAPPTVVYVTATSPSRQPQLPNARWRNKPQTNATAAGAMIFSSAGMNMALGLGWSKYSLYSADKHFGYSWFIGVIIGTILALPLRNFLTKKWIMAAAGVLILVEGLLYVSVPHNVDAMLAGRYLNGIAAGLTIVPFLMNASEIAIDSYRGSCLATEQYFVSFGIAIQMIYASYWTPSLNYPVYLIHGIFDIVFGVATAGFLLLYIESPIELLRQGNETAALDCLAGLQLPKGVTMETRALFEHHKAYVREQESLTVGESLRQGALPLLKMLFFRSMMLVFCCSLPLNITLKYSMLLNGNIWAATVAAACRIFGAFATYFLADSMSRKLPSIISALIIGSLLIGLGSLFRSLATIVNYSDMTTAMALYIVVQAVVGFYTPFTSVYLGEAFPLRVKPYLMAVCVIVEQLIQIVSIETISVYIGDNLMTQGIIAVVVFLLLALSMPETRNTSLGEAQRRFRQLLYVKVN